MRLGSQMPLPTQRETLVHFFEQVQKPFSTIFRMRKPEGNEFSIEEERSGNSYRWVSVEPTRLTAGHVNPVDVAAALKLHQWILEVAPYDLGVRPIEIDYLDILFGFDLNFSGNHDEIIAESLFPGSPMACLLDLPGGRAIDFQPTATVAISDDLRLQARIDVVTRTNTFQVRNGEFNDEAISVYLIIRRFWGDRPKTSLAEMVPELAAHAEQLATSHVLPNIVRPIGSAIASRS